MSRARNTTEDIHKKKKNLPQPEKKNIGFQGQSEGQHNKRTMN